MLLDTLEESEKNGCRKKAVCEGLGISLRSTQNWKKSGTSDRRKGSVKTVPSKLSPNEHKEILNIACSDRFKNLTPHEIVPLLAEEERYIASVSTFYRVLALNGMIQSRPISIHGPTNSRIEVKATGPNQLWSWDISWLKTDVLGKYYYLYLFIDIWSRCIVGWKIYEQESAEMAKELFCEIAKERNVKGVMLHSDNGSPMISSQFRLTLERLGVIPSFSRPNVSNDNAYSESLFKTVKYTVGYPQCFTTIESAHDFMKKFVYWYNNEHRHSRIGYVTPMQRHQGKDIEIFTTRNRAFQAAQKKNPERWSGKPKYWKYDQEVFLKKGNFSRKAS
jgi:transposase InsO family protein